MYLSGINPQGDIIGTYDESNVAIRSFLLSRGSFTMIDVPGALPGLTIAYAINAKVNIVGAFLNNVGSGLHGFLLSNGTYTTIDVPAALGVATQAFAINPQGDIVGTDYDASFNLHGFLREQALVRRPTNFTEITGPENCQTIHFPPLSALPTFTLRKLGEMLE